MPILIAVQMVQRRSQAAVAELCPPPISPPIVLPEPSRLPPELALTSTKSQIHGDIIRELVALYHVLCVDQTGICCKSLNSTLTDIFDLRNSCSYHFMFLHLPVFDQVQDSVFDPLISYFLGVLEFDHQFMIRGDALRDFVREAGNGRVSVDDLAVCTGEVVVFGEGVYREVGEYTGEIAL